MESRSSTTSRPPVSHDPPNPAAPGKGAICISIVKAGPEQIHGANAGRATLGATPRLTWVENCAKATFMKDVEQKTDRSRSTDGITNRGLCNHCSVA